MIHDFQFVVNKCIFPIYTLYFLTVKSESFGLIRLKIIKFTGVFKETNAVVLVDFISILSTGISKINR
jgi:hypothetical protein